MLLHICNNFYRSTKFSHVDKAMQSVNSEIFVLHLLYSEIIGQDGRTIINSRQDGRQNVVVQVVTVIFDAQSSTVFIMQSF